MLTFERLSAYGFMDLRPVMGSLETLSRLETRQYFHCLCLCLGLEGYCLCLVLGLECSVLLSCLVDTFIETAVT